MKIEELNKIIDQIDDINLVKTIINNHENLDKSILDILKEYNYKEEVCKLIFYKSIFLYKSSNDIRILIKKLEENNYNKNILSLMLNEDIYLSINIQQLLSIIDKFKESNYNKELYNFILNSNNIYIRFIKTN